MTKNFSSNSGNDSSQMTVNKSYSTATVCNSCFKVKSNQSQVDLKSANTKKTKGDESDEVKSNPSSNSIGMLI